MDEPRGAVTRVLLADDYRLFTRALCAVLDNEPGIEVVGVAHDGDEAVELAAALAPDIAVLDVRMPHRDGIEAGRGIRAANPDVRVMILAGLPDADEGWRALEAGAVAYVTKDRAIDRLAETILLVAGARTAGERSTASPQPLR